MKLLRVLCSCQEGRVATIKEEGGKFVLYSKDGSKKLGEFDSEAEALAREEQIKRFKSRDAAAVYEKDGKFCHATADGGEMCHDTRAEAEGMVSGSGEGGPHDHKHEALRGARAFRLAREGAGAFVTKQFQGREHIVVPVVALVEGVIHASNAETPELVLSSEFEKNLQAWNGRPVMLDHPKVDDEQVSANDPRILDEYQIGTVFNARVDGKKLKMDAYVDPEKLDKMGDAGQKMLAKIKSGEMTEVSVGTFVVAEPRKGMLGDKPFGYVWRDIASDHLAFLPEGLEGACSIEMGCGAPRAAVLKFEPRAASCGCGSPGIHDASAEEKKMDKKKRIELIIASGKTTFKAADAAVLEGLSEEAIKALEDEIAAKAKATTEAPAVQTEEQFLASHPDVKAAVDAQKADAALTPEQREEKLLAQSPGVAAIVKDHKAAQKAKHEALVSKLKAAQKAYTEEELKAMSVAQLEKVALLAIKEPVSYEGAGAPRAAEGSEDEIPAPPSLAKRFRDAALKGSAN